MQKQGSRELAIHLSGKLVQKVSLGERDVYEVGRVDSNALCFRDAQGLSRKHAAFERSGSAWTVRDIGSTNGTFVNGKRILDAHTLRSGDRVTLGELMLVFLEADLPAQAGQTVLFVDKAASLGDTVEATLDDVLEADAEIQDNPHMKALVQAGRELCGHLSLDGLFQVILQLAVDTVNAARGALLTIEEGDFRMRASKGQGFRISAHVRDLVVKERRSLLVRDALSDSALAGAMSIVQDQIRGILAVPLQTEKQVIGLIYLDSPVHVREFTKDDLNLLTVLANIAAIRIEQARLIEIEQAERIHARELEHAALIQRSILPGDAPPFPHRKDVGLHASMVPAKEVGGDLFDYFLLDEDHLGFVVGDVSGKGVPAALFMAVARTLLRATSENQKGGPGECLTYMNRTLAAGNSAGMFVTLFYAVLDTRTGELAFANAGHNPPYIVTPQGQLRKLSQKSGPMLALFDGHEYGTLTARLEPGEGILLYTDGVTEAVNKQGEFFGDERLESYLAGCMSSGAQALVEGLHAAVAAFATGVPRADDITVLGLRYFP
ncbi:MAG TPA: SpoIIE family protein phosphatase [Bryobacteraceae bacterium]|nr:SpoIIE family protein phosphatase [Bryobacteraceae bacterium]